MSSSISTTLSFKGMESKHYLRRGKNYMKKVCKSLREHAIKAINFKKKKMKLLTNKQYKSYENATACYICSEKFEDKNIKDKIIS